VTDTTTTTTATTTATPWHTGIEADTIGWWQNKGYDVADPKALAGKITEQYRALEKFHGAPADRLVRLPERPDDEAGWKAVWQRLGAPKEAKEYDFAGVKFTDGTELEASFTDTMRATFAKAHVPKETATEVTKAVVKYLESADTEEAAVRAAALATEKATLTKNWGNKFEFNKLTAMQGAQRLGVTEEEVGKLESVVGYSKVMEMFRRIGAATSEDTFVEGRGGPSNNVATVEGAKAKLAELMDDQDWGKRLLKNDTAAVREFENLTRLAATAA
jgi:hypothetical protein